MIEQLKRIWLGLSPRLKFVLSGSFFLLLAYLVISLLFRGAAIVPSVAPSASVVLNEVLFSPSSDQLPFVELKRVSGHVSLSGFKLRNEKAEEYFFPDNTPAFERDSFLLVTFDGGNKLEGATLHAGPRLFLNGVAGFVELVAPDGRVLDRVAWGSRQPESVKLGRGGAHGDFVAGVSIGRHPLSVKPVDFFEWLTFSADEVTPGKPNPNPRAEVLLPLDGAFVSQPSIKLGWYPVAGATSYRIQISTDSEFNGTITDSKTQTPSFKTPALEAGDYFWRVQAVFEDGSSAEFSPVNSFTISSTELPNFPAQSSYILIPNAYAAETVPPLREGVLAVPMIYQHKDTAMLQMESRNESGTHAWDKDHGELDESDPSDNTNCVLASIAMVNTFAGGDLSQDRIGYEILEGNDVLVGIWPNDPVWDLNYGRGFYDNETFHALTFAFNGASVVQYDVTSADALWDTVTREIDAGRPVVAGVPGHVIVITGYYQFSQSGPNARWLTINDPWSGRYLLNLERMANRSRVERYWLVSDTSNPRRNEAGLTRDSDGDGMVDFDETERFKTKPGNRDSDQDGVDDKTEVYATVFDPDHGWAQWRAAGFGRDLDEDKRFMELDRDSDGGGCKDGEEDKNANGKRDGGETYNFDKEDDECAPGPLGGRVKITYAYAPVRPASCIGRMEIQTWFTLNPEIIPDAPNIILNYRADEMTYDIRTDGCPDAPGDRLLYDFSEGFHLSGTLPLTEESFGFAIFSPSLPKFAMQLPFELTGPSGASNLKGTYTTITGGGPWSAETHVVFEPLNISSDSAVCADPGNPLSARPDKLEFCTEPTPCSDQLSAPLECLTEPQRFYVIPFNKSFRWDTPRNEPGERYHIGEVDVLVEICEGCGDEFLN